MRPFNIHLYEDIADLTGVAVEECRFSGSTNPNELVIRVEWDDGDNTTGYWPHRHLTRVEL